MFSKSSIALSCSVLSLWLYGLMGSAWSHAYPASTTPSDGAVLPEPPREVRIQFTEAVELEFSRITVKNSSGEVVNRQSVRRISSDTLAVDLSPLRPGSYTVEWRVLSVDTHVTEGLLHFTFGSAGR